MLSPDHAQQASPTSSPAVKPSPSPSVEHDVPLLAQADDEEVTLLPAQLLPPPPQFV